METITISKEEYERLKKKVKKSKIPDDTVYQLKLSLEDIKHGRVSKF